MSHVHRYSTTPLLLLNISEAYWTEIKQQVIGKSSIQLILKGLQKQNSKDWATSYPTFEQTLYPPLGFRKWLLCASFSFWTPTYCVLPEEFLSVCQGTLWQKRMMMESWNPLVYLFAFLVENKGGYRDKASIHSCPRRALCIIHVAKIGFSDVRKTPLRNKN